MGNDDVNPTTPTTTTPTKLVFTDNTNEDIALLRSRIDQQSELICILKKRADEFLLKYTERDQDYEKVRLENERLTSLYDDEVKKSNGFEGCYLNLGKSYQELCTSKKDVDTTLERLKKECEILNAENMQFLMKFESKDTAIKSLQETIVKKDGEISKLEAINKENLQQLQAKEETGQASIFNIKKGFHDEMDKLNEDLSTIKCSLSDTKKELDVSKQQEKDLESKLVGAMNKYASEKKRSMELEEKLHKRSDKILAGEKEVLQKKIVELEEKHSKALKNFNAYKGHAQDLLLQERSLNNKLRRLKSPDACRSESVMTVEEVGN